MKLLNQASNLAYALRHANFKTIDDLDLIDIYYILENLMELLKKESHKKDIIL